MDDVDSESDIGGDDTRNRDTRTAATALLTRRRTIATAGTVLGAAGMLSLGTVFTTGTAFAIQSKSLTASDFSLTSNSGQVKDVYVKPDLDYAWDGLDEQPTSCEFAVSVEGPALDGSMTQLGTETDSNVSSALDGSDTYQFSSSLSLIQNGGPWSKSDFRVSGAGTADKTQSVGPITVEIEGTLNTASSSYTDTASADFTVEVTNEGVAFGNGNGGGIGGSAGAGGTVPGGN